MSEQDDIHNALAAIHSRLGTIEGRVTLIARAEREELRRTLEEVVRDKPLLGQIYLALDGARNQNQVYELLDGLGVQTSLMGVSRALVKLHTEYGVIELVSGGGSKIYRKGTASESVLNLATHVRGWLKSVGAVDPAPPAGRRRRRND